MPRPALRPMRTLPTLEARRGALETCTFCPKLCRSACPVSNAEPRETLTPWGKMSAAWMAAHGDTPLDPTHAASAWACTGCLGCREMCDHRNPVADTLVDARGALARAGVAPAGARRAIAGFAAHRRATGAAARALSGGNAGPRGTTALVIGCAYLRGAPGEARDALDAARALALGPVHVVEACCGLPLRLAGDASGFEAQAQAFAREVQAFASILVVDAGCALALRRHHPSVPGVKLGEVELLIERADRHIEELPAVAAAGEPVRWHDPCQLGRGLGIYDAPRRVLGRVTGGPVGELGDSRELAPCSGGGGLLPWTMPDVARSIADTRIAEHRAAGGGRVVTGCASSLITLRKRGRAAGVAVDDIVTYLARSLRARAP